MDYNVVWLFKLILAHLISDFLLQKDSWVTDRNTKHAHSAYLYFHIGITALTALLLIGYSYWGTLLVITISHYIIDVIKSYLPDKLVYFFLDQFAHFMIIITCWMVNFSVWPNWIAIEAFYNSSPLWIYAVAGFFLTYPAGIIVAKATSRWASQFSSSSESEEDSAGLKKQEHTSELSNVLSYVCWCIRDNMRRLDF